MNVADNTRSAFYDYLLELHTKDPALMPFGTTLGFRVESIKPGESIVSMDCNDSHSNVMGSTHGGAIFTLADTAIGIAHLATLEHGQTTTTVEAKINFLRPAFHGELKAHARTVKQGRTLSLLECDVYDSKQRLVARASSTMMTLEGDRVQGRDRFLVQAAPGETK